LYDTDFFNFLLFIFHFMAKEKNTGSLLQDSEVKESKIPKDVMEILNILLAEKEKREKDEKTKKYVWISILMLFLYNTFIFFSTYSYFTSPQFLENVKYKTIEVLPSISQELGRTAEKSAPVLFDGLKTQFEAYLPVLKDKILEQYKLLNEQAITMSKDQFNNMINSQMNDQLMKINVANGGQMSQAQLDELKLALIAGVTASMNDIIAKNVSQQLSMCIEEANIFKQVGEQVTTATIQINEKLDSKSEIERKKIGYDILRSFLDAADNHQTGRAIPGLTPEAPTAPVVVPVPAKK